MNLTQLNKNNPDHLKIMKELLDNYDSFNDYSYTDHTGSPNEKWLKDLNPEDLDSPPTHEPRQNIRVFANVPDKGSLVIMVAGYEIQPWIDNLFYLINNKES
jgi:hypothetical protein